MRIHYAAIVFLLLSGSINAQIQPEYVLESIANCSNCTTDTFYIESDNFEVSYFDTLDSEKPRGMQHIYHDTIIYCYWSEPSGDIDYSFSFRTDGSVHEQRVHIKGATISLFYYWENGRIGKIEHYDDSLYCNNGWFTEFDPEGNITSQEFYVNGLTQEERSLSEEEQRKLIKRPYDTCLCNEYNK